MPDQRPGLPDATDAFQRPTRPLYLWGGIDWAFLLAAVGLGLIGSKYWYGVRPQFLAGFPFQLASLWFLWKAFPWGPEAPTPPTRTQPSTLPGAFPAGVLWGRTDLSWFLVLLLLAGLGQMLFLDRQVGPALLLWAMALTIVHSLQKGSALLVPGEGAPRSEWRPLFLLLGVAVLMRFPFVGQHVAGYQIDEGLCTTDGIDYATGVMTSPFITTNWGANASFHFWWLGQFMRVFGDTATATRSFSALVSIGVLFVFYHWCRLYFAKWPSLAACFLMSVGWWFLFYSLSPFQNILVVFWEVLAFYYIGRALRDGRKLDYFRGGLFLAMMAMEYIPGRAGGPMIALALLGILAVEGRPFLKTHFRGLLLSLFSMVWLAGPFIRYFLSNLETTMGRTKQLSLIYEVQRTGDYFLFVEKWFWTLLSFVHPNPAADLRFSAKAPMIDPWSGGLLLLGIFLALLNLRQRVSWFLLSGLLLGMATTALAIQGPGPDPTYVNGLRYFVVVPFLFLASALGLDWAFRAVSCFSAPVKKGLAALLVAGLMGSLAWNARVFYVSFRDFKSTDSYWGSLGFNHIQVADYLNANCPRCHAVVDGEYTSSVVTVLTRKRFPLNTLADPLALPIDREVTKDVLVITLRWNNLPIQEGIRKHYPHAKWGTLNDPNGKGDTLTIEIPQADIQALQKGKTLGPPLK